MTGRNLREVLGIALVGLQQLIKGLEIPEVAQLQAHLLLAYGIIAVAQGNLQHLGQVDDIIGRAHAGVIDHILAAAEEGVLLRLVTVQVHAVHHRRHGGVVIVQQGVGQAALRKVIGSLAHRPGHPLVHTQGHLGLSLVMDAAGLHGKQAEQVQECNEDGRAQQNQHQIDEELSQRKLFLQSHFAHLTKCRCR